MREKGMKADFHNLGYLGRNLSSPGGCVFARREG